VSKSLKESEKVSIRKALINSYKIQEENLKRVNQRIDLLNKELKGGLEKQEKLEL